MLAPNDANDERKSKEKYRRFKKGRMDQFIATGYLFSAKQH